MINKTAKSDHQTNDQKNVINNDTLSPLTLKQKKIPIKEQKLLIISSH